MRTQNRNLDRGFFFFGLGWEGCFIPVAHNWRISSILFYSIIFCIITVRYGLDVKKKLLPVYEKSSFFVQNASICVNWDVKMSLAFVQQQQKGGKGPPPSQASIQKVYLSCQMSVGCAWAWSWWSMERIFCWWYINRHSFTRDLALVQGRSPEPTVWVHSTWNRSDKWNS